MRKPIGEFCLGSKNLFNPWKCHYIALLDNLVHMVLNIFIPI